MPLDFHNNAICLSGEAGTKLKSDVIGQYYRFWWKITSGGQRAEFQNPTAIIEMNAATGEVYIEDAQETLLGSAGHALDLKVSNPNTNNLKVILIENDDRCFYNLKQVIARNWPSIDLDKSAGPIATNTTGVYLINNGVEQALEDIKHLQLGNSLYFFDPLRSVEYSTISKVTGSRMPLPFMTGTEFFIFSFTSDWFLGRKGFSPLPIVNEKNKWTDEEAKTVQQADELFGNDKWRVRILTDQISNDQKQTVFMRLYKNRLLRWFRYVLPLPFNPKDDQLFHLILCSNYEAGVRMTKNHYSEITHNPRYLPNNGEAYEQFEKYHPKLFYRLPRNRRPTEWKILWKIITQHEENLCDYLCNDLIREEPNLQLRVNALNWLLNEDYLKLVKIDNAWEHNMKRYAIKWATVRAKLGVDMPPKLRPISPQQLKLWKTQNVEE